MNWNYFSVFGYLSVLLWIGMPLLWLVHARMRPRRWWCHAALLLGVLAFVLARINSETHVNRIQPERGAEMAGLEARQEAKRQAAADSRGDEVADIRFAEDGSQDFLDKAGMDEADLKYMDKLDKDAVPEWKKKKGRSTEGAAEDGLESKIGGADRREGVATKALENAAEKEPILMSAKDLDMANRLDALNLNAIRFMLLLGVLMVVTDYLRRANIYQESYLPLPLPSGWLISPPAAVVAPTGQTRRSMPAELAWLIKRGDSFVYLTDSPAKAEMLPKALSRFGKKWKMVDLLHVTGGDGGINDEFVFEALWFGRGSFIVDHPARAKELLEGIVKRLETRKIARARVRQTVHVVWDLREPVPESIRSEFEKLAPSTGFSLLDVHNSPSN